VDKRLILVSIVIVLVLLVSLFHPSGKKGQEPIPSNQTYELANYSHPSLNYSVQYPADWSIETVGQVTAFIGPRGEGNFSVNVYIESFYFDNHTIALQRTLDHVRWLLSDMRYYKSDEPSLLAWGDNPALETVVTYSMPNVAIKEKLFFIDTGKGRTYVIAYTSRDRFFYDHLWAYEKIKQSFDIY
jgi:hypothetical protein